MKSDLTAAAIQHQFVTRFTSMVVVEDGGARSEAVHTKIKHTKEWMDELDGLYQDAAVKEMIEKEAERLAVYESENSRKRRSSETAQRAAVFHPLRWILPAAALLAMLRLKRWFTRF
mgnify:CR=1 FL=1